MSGTASGFGFGADRKRKNAIPPAIRMHAKIERALMLLVKIVRQIKWIIQGAVRNTQGDALATAFSYRGAIPKIRADRVHRPATANSFLAGCFQPYLPRAIVRPESGLFNFCHPHEFLMGLDI